MKRWSYAVTASPPSKVWSRKSKTGGAESTPLCSKKRLSTVQQAMDVPSVQSKLWDGWQTLWRCMLNFGSSVSCTRAIQVGRGSCAMPRGSIIDSTLRPMAERALRNCTRRGTSRTLYPGVRRFCFWNRDQSTEGWGADAAPRKWIRRWNLEFGLEDLKKATNTSSARHVESCVPGQSAEWCQTTDGMLKHS